MAVNVSQMFPMLPTGDSTLEDLARDVVARSAKLSGMLVPKSQVGVIELVRLINSYYSNLIEGRSTHPSEIERAMHSDYASEPAKRNLQMESLAHIHCQKTVDSLLRETPDLDPSTPEFLAWVHGLFYEKLPEELHWVENPETHERVKVIGGQFRTRDVAVGRHQPPEHQVITDFLKTFYQHYRRGQLHGVKPLIAFAAAHHRLMWIHPFLDGNGRVARLYTDACFRTFPIEGYGLWNVSRGLARSRDRYMQYLDEADYPRQNDYDGRGNLSNKALVQFCSFFLETCLDQIDYMTEMLGLHEIMDRLKGYVHARNDKRIPPPSGHAPGMKLDAIKMLEAVLVRGELGRGQVAAAASTERTGREVLAQLVTEGVLVSSMPKGPVRLAYPTHLAGHLFPDLFPMGGR